LYLSIENKVALWSVEALNQIQKMIPFLDTYELTTEPTETSEQFGLGFFYIIFCCMSGKEDGEEDCV
jgi:hypothetical protein